MTPALVRSALSIANQPAAVNRVVGGYCAGLFTSTMATFARAVGVPATGQDLVKDKRFADPAWSQHPGFFWLREQFTLLERAVNALVDAADVTPQERGKTRFVTQALIDAAWHPRTFRVQQPGGPEEGPGDRGCRSALARGAAELPDGPGRGTGVAATPGRHRCSMK